MPPSKILLALLCSPLYPELSLFLFLGFLCHTVFIHYSYGIAVNGLLSFHVNISGFIQEHSETTSLDLRKVMRATVYINYFVFPKMLEICMV